MIGEVMAWVRSESVGHYGHTVLLYERTEGRLYLRYGKPFQYTALRHGDWDRGLREARELAGVLLAGTQKPEKGRALIRHLLTRYFVEVSRFKKDPQPREEARRVAVWTTFLPLDTKAEDCTPDVMRRFILARRTGTIKLPNVVPPARQLSTRVTETTIGHDIAFLQFVLTWAYDKSFIGKNPLRKYARPKTANPLPPVGSP